MFDYRKLQNLSFNFKKIAEDEVGVGDNYPTLKQCRESKHIERIEDLIINPQSYINGILHCIKCSEEISSDNFSNIFIKREVYLPVKYYLYLDEYFYSIKVKEIEEVFRIIGHKFYACPNQKDYYNNMLDSLINSEIRFFTEKALMNFDGSFFNKSISFLNKAKEINNRKKEACEEIKKILNNDKDLAYKDNLEFKDFFFSLFDEKINPLKQDFLNLIDNYRDIYVLVENPMMVKCPVCDTCNENNIVSCYEDDCDEIGISDNFIDVEINGKLKYFCKTHATFCKECEDSLSYSYDSVEHDGDYYHEGCYADVFFTCDNCNNVEKTNQMHLPTSGPFEDQALCRSCFNTLDLEGLEDGGDGNHEIKENAKKYLNNRGSRDYYPLDKGSIIGNIIPVLESAEKKFKDKEIDDSVKQFILSKIQKQESKAAVSSELDSNSTINDCISVFKNNLKYLDELNSTFNGIKGYKPIPSDLRVEDSYLNNNAIVFAIYPNEKTLSWAEKMMPGAKFVYKRYLERLGHHTGALGYARITKDKNVYIIDNLQTDLDKQNSSLKSLVNIDFDKGSKKIKDAIYVELHDEEVLDNTIKAIETKDIESIQNDPHMFSYYEENTLNELKDKLKEKRNKRYNLESQLTETEELEKSTKINGFSREEIDKILNWWFIAIDKFYAPYLVQRIRDFGRFEETPVYLTSFDMQKDKWAGIPDRNKDIYDKLPRLMGFNTEIISANPERLGYGEYEMSRIAKLINNLSYNFIKEAGRNLNLYHGTSIDKVNSIKEYGLIPQVGDWVKDSYGIDIDLDADSEDYYGINEDQKPIFDLVFAADKGTISSAVGGMTAAVAKYLGKSFHEVTEDDLEKFGALVVMKHSYDPIDDDSNSFKFKPKQYDSNWEYKNPNYPTVEPGDYFSEDNIYVDQVLTGKPMVRVLMQNNSWPLFNSDKRKRQDIIKFMIDTKHKLPHKENPTREEVVDWVRGLPESKVNEYHVKVKN